MPFEPDSSGPAPPTPGTIYAVDITGLSDFAAFVQQECDSTFAPGRQRVEQDSANGVQWGATMPGDLIEASRMACWSSQGQMMHNLAHYVGTSTAIVDAIHQLMNTYRTADDLAAVKPEQMIATLTAAFAAQQPTISRIPSQTGAEG
jgi:hypothetical protein